MSKTPAFLGATTVLLAALAQTPKGRKLLWEWDRYSRLAKVF